jgi:hypothetical protein
MAKRTDSHAAGALPAGMPPPQPGTLVWLLRDGGFGRVVAVGQGGLICRVRLERDGALVGRPGCELLSLAADAGT